MLAIAQNQEIEEITNDNIAEYIDSQSIETVHIIYMITFLLDMFDMRDFPQENAILTIKGQTIYL